MTIGIYKVDCLMKRRFTNINYSLPITNVMSSTLIIKCRKVKISFWGTINFWLDGHGVVPTKH